MMMRQGLRRWSSQYSSSLRRIGEQQTKTFPIAVAFSTSEERTIVGQALQPENDARSQGPSDAERLWMGPEVSLQEKIESLLNHPPGDLHRLDLHLTAQDLITESCKRRSVQGMQQAHDILNRILFEKRSSDNIMIPVAPFEEVLFGWTRLAHSASPQKLREVLRLMEREHAYDVEEGLFLPHEEGDDAASRSSCQPTTGTYNTILRGLAQVAKKDANAAFEAENLLLEMMDRHRELGWKTKPNTRSWTHVIHAHGNSGLNGAGDRAEKVLKHMTLMHENELKIYNAKMEQPYDLRNPAENVYQIVTPDERVYSTVISAIVNSGAKYSAERARDLLTDLLDAGVKLDAFAFNAVIVGFAKLADAKNLPSPKQRFEAATKAEELAFTFLDNHSQIAISDKKLVSPAEIEDHWQEQLTIGFNAAIGAWARSDVGEAATRAEALFSVMVESPMLRPDRYSMNNTLNAWARARDPYKAEEMLDFMTSLHESDPDGSATPDAYSYCIVMSAWAKSRAPDKTVQVRRLLEKVLTKYEEEGVFRMKPNLVAFTTVLNAAGHTTEQEVGDDSIDVTEEAYNIATQTYEELVNDSLGLNLKPDALVFAAMLKVIRVHTDKTSVERRHMLERVFDDSCAAGQVSSHVIKEVRLGAPDKDLLARLFRSEDLAKHLPNVRELPTKWSKNVPKQPRFLDVDVKGSGKQRKGGGKQWKGGRKSKQQFKGKT